MREKFEKLGEGIKNKVILPAKRWVELASRRVRLSLTLRIAYNFLRLMIINGILFFIIFVVLYINVSKDAYAELAESIVVAIESRGSIFDGEVNPYKDRNIYLEINDIDKKGVLYSDLIFPLENSLGIFGQFHVNLNDNSEYRLILEDQINFQVEGKEYIANFYYDMTNDYYRMWELMGYLAVVYLFLIFFTVRESKSDSVKMLQPIGEMAETVNRLRAGNLSSERLNVERTNDELKDLAEGFNKMLDRLDASYENQKMFVSNASHELRTPIAVIQGYANMLHRWGMRDAAVLQESVDAIQVEAKEMQELVNKLLFLSRHDKKMIHLEKKPFNMCPVVEEMAKETAMVTLNHTIVCQVLENVEVYGDKQSLKQALRVFIDNAIKYTPEGGTIRISCRNAGGDCILMVEDNGIGMKQEDLDRIFDRFYRSDEVRDRKISGHGLGLSIAKLIIMAHAGRIKIRTQFTKGTTFIVTIPKRRVTA